MQGSRRTGSPGQFAAALKYVPDRDAAPKVTASGRGEIARRILDVACQYGIPVHKDPDLVAVLSQLDLGEEIPPVLYRVVAELLVFVYRMNILASREKGPTK